MQLEQRVNPLDDLNQLIKEPKSFWIGILEKYFVKNNFVSIECYPSKEEQQKMAKDEKERIEKQRQELGDEGLRKQKEILEKAIEFNDREPPIEMLTSVAIPNIDSIKFHNIKRYRTDSEQDKPLDLSKTSLFTYFDDLKTSFVYVSLVENVFKSLVIYSKTVVVCSSGHI